MPRRSTLRLTKRIVDGLSVDDKDAVFWDRDLSGFGVRVHATGRKVYVVQSRGPAGLKRVSLGPVAGRSIEQRRREAAEIIDRIKRGEDPVPPAVAPEPTVTGLALQFLKAHVATRCKPGTARNYRMALDLHILPALGEMALKDVGRQEVGALHHDLRATPAMANRVIWVLSRMFALAEVWAMAPPGSNPCRHVRPFRQTARKRFLTPAEYRRVGAVLKGFEADGSMHPPAIAALRLLMLTGCRTTEILTLQWDDVDRTARVLRLRDAKAGPRMVPLTTPALAVLDRMERTGDVPWVFRGRRPGARLPGLASCWQRVQTATGLHDVRIHDLRHSHASRALALGESLTMIGKLLGHTGVRTTARYAHLVRDAEKAAAARTGDSIGAHLVRPDAKAA